MDNPVDESSLPYILRGKYFKVTQKETGNPAVKATCLNCPNGPTYSGTILVTSNFSKHLKSKHPQLHAHYETEVKEDLKRKRSQPRKICAESGHPPITDIPNKSMTETESLILNFVVKGIHPLSIVEEEGFKELVTGLNPYATIISRSTLVRRINDQYNTMKSDLALKLEKVKHLCITVDAWTCGGKSRGFLGMTVHWIKDDLTRDSAALACRRFKGSHTFDRIAKLILQILKEYNIPVGKVTKCVTDNGANFVKSFMVYGVYEDADKIDDEDDDTLRQRIPEDIDECEFIDVDDVLNHPSQNRDEEEDEDLILPTHQRCCSHLLNLIPSSDMNKGAGRLQRSAFAKCQAIWNKQSRSTAASEKIKELCGVLLKSPVVTRWNSYYDAISQLLKLEDKVKDLCKIAGSKEFSDAEMIFLHNYKTAMKPLAQALDRLQGDQRTYYGELIPIIFKIQKDLSGIGTTPEVYQDQESTSIPPPSTSHSSRKQRSHTIHEIISIHFNKRFGGYLSLSPEHNDAIIASFSHPYHKLWWFDGDNEKYNELRGRFIETVVAEVKAPTTSFSPASPSPSQSLREPDPKAPQEKADNDFFHYRKRRQDDLDLTLTFEKKLRSECVLYLKDADESLESLNKYPNIRSIFIKYNTALPTSAPVERLFSYANMVLSNKRRCLSDSNFEKLTLLKVNKY